MLHVLCRNNARRIAHSCLLPQIKIPVSPSTSVVGFNGVRDSAGQKYHRVYKFPYITYLRALSRLKIFQTGVTVCILPVTWYQHSQEIIQSEMFYYGSGVAALACIMLYVISVYLRRVIGLVDIDETKNFARISHLTFWGNKKEQIVAISNIEPVTDTNQKVYDIFCEIKTYDYKHLCFRYAGGASISQFALGGVCYYLVQSTMSNLTDYSNLLHPCDLKALCKMWLSEDISGFDHGGFVVGEAEETGVLICKSEGVLAGIPFCSAIFKELNCEVEWHFQEGSRLAGLGETVATATGPVRCLLLAERVVLNCISRASGIATKAANLKKLASDHLWHGEIVGTRKTTPGFRLVEKYSLLVGGAGTHRFNLSDLVMLKDNHIWTVGSVAQAVKKAKLSVGFTRKIEVECRSLEESIEALTAGADVIMLDNLKGQVLYDIAKVIKKKFPHSCLEASGGVDEHNLKDYFNPYIDIISAGSLTHSYNIIDFSFKISKLGHDPKNPIIG